jgi:hypothetical protein
LTTRQRFAQHISNAVCASCHDQIDGIGFGFEEFDGVGVYRATENGQSVLSSGTIIGTGEIDGPFDGASDLSTKIAGSHLLADCFVRQAYRFAMGQVEPDGDSMQPLENGFSPDAPMTAALSALMQSPIFTDRTNETGGP